MRWYLLLIWAQGLRQAPLPASGAVSGKIITTGNVSAEEGGSVTLQCHLPSTTAKVTQVNWEQRDQLLAVRHANLGWHIYPAFRERVAPGPNLGLTLQSLTRNDTGEYFCTYHTYPDGIYRGAVFLEVLQSSAAEHSASSLIPLLGATATGLAVICVAVITVVILTRKDLRCGISSESPSIGVPSHLTTSGGKKPHRVHCEECGLRTTAREEEEWNAHILSSAGRGSQAGTAPVAFCTAPKGEDCAEPHDYFNVLSYRSLGSFSFAAETG